MVGTWSQESNHPLCPGDKVALKLMKASSSSWGLGEGATGLSCCKRRSPLGEGAVGGRALVILGFGARGSDLEFVCSRICLLYESFGFCCPTRSYSLSSGPQKQADNEHSLNHFRFVDYYGDYVLLHMWECGLTIYHFCH